MDEPMEKHHQKPTQQAQNCNATATCAAFRWEAALRCQRSAWSPSGLNIENHGDLGMLLLWAPHGNGLVCWGKSSPETHGFLPSNIGGSG